MAAAGLAAVALLGTATAQSASAVQAASTPLSHASPASLNCVYEVVSGTEFYSQGGRQILPLDVGSLLYGPQSNVIGHNSAFLYSYTYDENGWVATAVLYEQYCDP